MQFISLGVHDHPRQCPKKIKSIIFRCARQSISNTDPCWESTRSKMSTTHREILWPSKILRINPIWCGISPYPDPCWLDDIRKMKSYLQGLLSSITFLELETEISDEVTSMYNIQCILYIGRLSVPNTSLMVNNWPQRQNIGLNIGHSLKLIFCRCCR